MDAIDELNDAETTRLIIRLRRRLVEAERAINRPQPDEDERAALVTMLVTLREIAAARPQLAPKLQRLIATYEPLAG